ncbi:MAG: DUF692 family protein [Deltaproteobacteria bacterium]|nr:DUF692 family protein [Deltaproteobacteria bacterium]
MAISHLFKIQNEKTVKILDFSDTLEIKFLPEPDWLPAEKKRIFHSGLGLVEAGFRDAFDEITPYLIENDVGLYSCDLGPSAERYTRNIPISPVLDLDAILDGIRQSVAFIRERFPGRLAVENYNYYPTGLYEHVCRPDFITGTLEELDMGLVLDISHAAVTAHNLKTEFLDYVKELPLHRLVEIHLARPTFENERRALALDAHSAPGLREYRWLEGILGLLKNDPREIYLVVEYYRHLARLCDILAAAREFCEAHAPAIFSI